MTQSASSNGRFVWHELMTPDLAASVAFYSELFAWKTREVEMGSAGKYTMIKAGEQDIGGMAVPPAGKNVPPHWLAYCTVDDVDVAAKKAAGLGGQVAVPPMDIPTVGRFAIIADPQGGHIAPFRPASAIPESNALPAVGTFCWNELVARDPSAAVGFYRAVFGWSVEDKDMGPMGTYHILKRGETMTAGVMKAQDPNQPTAWLAYVAVDDVDASAKRAQRLRANVIVPPTDIPNIGRFSVIADPTGAAISLFKGAGETK